MKEETTKSLDDTEIPRTEWMMKWAGSIVLVVD